MRNVRPPRGPVGALALLLTATGLVVTTAGAATAAPHYERPPSVQVGWTDSATPDKAYQVGETHFPLGAWQDESGQARVSRVYATFDLSAFEGKKVYGGSVFIQEQSAADCTKRAIEIWRTKPVGATPTWNTAPAPLSKIDEVLTTGFCPASLTFDVGAALRDAAANRQRRVTFEIRVPAQHEADPSYGRRLNWYRSVLATVQYNSLPTVDNARLYNGGFPCTQLKPYPRIGGTAHVIQVVGNDADDSDQRALRTEVALWPTGDSAARTVFTSEHGSAGRANTIRLPEGTLVDGQTYAWQARVGDGADLSAWSKKCYFRYDATRPPTPTVTSSNYPRWEGSAQTPKGVPGIFTFSGNGKKDVAGFEYSWSGLGVPGVCEYSGDAGQLVCRDPFSRPNTVRADTPGGTATVSLSPTGSGPQRLTVRALDSAGNASAEHVYEVFVPSAEPEVTVENGPPVWGQEILLRFRPRDGVTGVVEYEVVLDSGEAETRTAEEDGTAYFRFTATDVDGHQVKVRSRSGNGFVSPWTTWSHVFLPWPGVRSEVYPSTGEPSGGVGVPGSFTFSRPPGGTDVTAYRYAFDDAEPTEVAADANGEATITWTPSTSGWCTLTVYAVRADGSQYDYANWYSFQVAESTP
ncbi:hypothetical protein CA850_16265 [Micromonospora echinospora]|uniref:hypothetical protein n=1 Tax=Micromonospora echinospora TaxID=1877 RepID=UPI000B5AC043|nr:hypothetical protein [Micromonospora echinospora]OZV79629.1 hypothetical protein CA850_16265 [Micromonospora echinospora]